VFFLRMKRTKFIPKKLTGAEKEQEMAKQVHGKASS